MNILMPAPEIVGEFAFSAFYSPGFHLPVVALDYADEVHEFAAPNRIVQHVAAWPEPIRSDHSRKMRRQPFHRHQAAPRHATSKLGPASPEQTATHLRVNTVGSNHEGRLCHMTVSESHLCILSRLGNRNTFPAEGNRVRLQTLDSLGQNAE